MRRATYEFATFDAALEAGKKGASVILSDVSNFLPEVVQFLTSPSKPPGIVALTHSRRVGAAEKYRGDVSTMHAFNFLLDESGETQLGIQPGATVLVSNDHFDHDGLCGVVALLDPEWALARKEFLVAVATTGDFNKVADRDAARVVWTIDAFTRPDTPGFMSPLPEETFKFEDMAELFGKLYKEMIPRFKDMVENISEYREYWQREDEEFEKSLSALRCVPPQITISRHPSISFAFVSIPDDIVAFSQFSLYTELAYASAGGSGDCYVVMTFHHGVFRLAYRYETFVDYVSAPTPARVSLATLAERLNAMDPSAVWRAGDVEFAEDRPHLGNKEKAGLIALSADVVEKEVVAFLEKNQARKD